VPHPAHRETRAGGAADRRRGDRGPTPGRWCGWRPGGRRLVGQRRSCAGELVAKDATGMVSPRGARPPASRWAAVGGTGGHHAGHRDPGRGRRPQEVRFHVGPGPLRQTVPRTCWRMRRRTAPASVSSSNALVRRDAPPESRRTDATRPPSAFPAGRPAPPCRCSPAHPGHARSTPPGRRASRSRRADGGIRRCHGPRACCHRRPGTSIASAPR